MSRPPSHRGQPIQLRRAQRPRRTELRATVERATGRLDVAALLQKKAFNQWEDDRGKPLRDSRFSFVKRLVVASAWSIEAHHYDGHIQAIGVKWCPTGYGGILHQRPLLLCPDCGNARQTLYFRLRSLHGLGHLACVKCQDLSYVSRQSSRDQRPLVRGDRIKTRLAHSPGMHRTTRRKLEWQLRALPKRRGRITKRLDHYRVRSPLSWLWR
jgi:hypothetical protein